MEIGASGIVFAFVVVMWAAYVLPLALRRYDEAEHKLPISGSFSRVIRTAAKESAQAAPVETPVTPAPKRQPAVMRGSARKAARRRRMILYVLVYLALGIGAAAGLSYLPMWSPAPPVLLVIAWLVTCRFQVRIEQRLTRPRKQASDTQMAGPDHESTVILSGQIEDYDPDVPHVMESVDLEADALDEKLQIAVPSTSVGGGVQWDPLPVTLPTYVTKPRAGRTVRTIDFDQPGTWTSGHVEGEQTELPLDASGDGDHQEAVGH